MMSKISKNIKKKGDRLLKTGNIKKDMDSANRLYFTVEGDTESHSVIFDKMKGKWSCDCKYSSMQNRQCSHIYACRLKMKEKN